MQMKETQVSPYLHQVEIEGFTYYPVAEVSRYLMIKHIYRAATKVVSRHTKIIKAEGKVITVTTLDGVLQLAASAVSYDQYNLQQLLQNTVEIQRKRVSEPLKAKTRPRTHSTKLCWSMGDYAKVLSSKYNLDIGRNVLFDYLRDTGYLINHGTAYNTPYGKYIRQGLFQCKLTKYNRGSKVIPYTMTFITEKGVGLMTADIVRFFRRK